MIAVEAVEHSTSNAEGLYFDVGRFPASRDSMFDVANPSSLNLVEYVVRQIRGFLESVVNSSSFASICVHLRFSYSLWLRLRCYKKSMTRELVQAMGTWSVAFRSHPFAQPISNSGSGKADERFVEQQSVETGNREHIDRA